MDWKLAFCSVLLLIGSIAAQDDSPGTKAVRTKVLKSRNLTLAPDGRRRRILKSRVLASTTTTTEAPVEDREELTAEVEVNRLEDEDLLTTLARTFGKSQTQAFLITETPIFEEPEEVTTPKPVRRTTTTVATTPRPKAKKVSVVTEEPVEETRKPNVETIRRFSHTNPDGSFTFGYESADGSFKEETRGTDCVVRGKYGYVDPDGVKREFTYVQGNPCVPGEDSEEDENKSEEEDIRTSTKRPVKVIRKKRPPQQASPEREDAAEEEPSSLRIASPARPAPEREPTVRRPTTRQTSPTIPPTTVATESPLKVTPAFTLLRPTTPSPRAEDVRIRDERPSIPFRPDPFRPRPTFDFEAEVGRIEQERQNSPGPRGPFIPEAVRDQQTNPRNEQAFQPRPTEPALSIPRGPTPPSRPEPVRPSVSFDFEAEVQRVELEKQNLPRPVESRPPQLQRFEPPASEQRFPQSNNVRELLPATPAPATTTRRATAATTTSTPRPDSTTTTTRTTESAKTTTSRPVLTTPRPPPSSQTPNGPPFTFFGPVPPEFSQFGPPQNQRPPQQEQRNPVEDQRQQRPPVPFRPEPQFTFFQRPEEGRFAPQDPRAQDPRFNEQFRSGPPQQFRPFSEPPQQFRSEAPRAPPQFGPPQLRPQEASAQSGRPEDPRVGRPESPRNQPPRQGERELSFPPPPPGFQPQQQRFGPPFTSFGPPDSRFGPTQQDPRFASPQQDPRFAQPQFPRSSSERPGQPQPSPAAAPVQRPGQQVRNDLAVVARGQIDQFLG